MTSPSSLRSRLSSVCRALVLIGIVAAGISQTTAFAAPQTPPPNPLLKIFLDCNRCDSDYLVTNVAFVDYVRDRAVADLHVLVTTQDTGGGGLEWTVKFIGLGRFKGHDHTLTVTTPMTATADDQRKEFARFLKLGLVFYVSDTPAAPQLDVVFKKPAEDAPKTPTKDPWNHWVFRLSGNSNFNGETSTKSLSYNLNGSANRTTDQWKISFSASSNKNSNTFNLDDGSTIKSATRSWSYYSQAVKSLNGHWSLGGTATISHSSFSNQNRVYKIAPGLEYDVFPYKDSTRRMLAVLYTVGGSHYDYSTVTIFDKLTETVPEHTVNVALSLKQPWGSLSASTNFTQQLNKFANYRIGTFTEADVRIFKGLSFNMYFEYDRIRNQISLAKGQVSTDEVLLRIRQLATDYSYYGGFGISYSFGSIFNNIVNPRFGGS